MANRLSPYGPVMAEPAAPLVPASGLGAALATLPLPWMVFRKEGFSSFDGAAGELYGGIYVALHPEKGVALIDLAPGQPHLALPRLRSFFRQTGLVGFSDEQPPIIAMTLMRGETHMLGRRLNDAFTAAPGCRLTDASWTEAAAAALVARFPNLRRIQSIESAASSPARAADEAAATRFYADIAAAPREARSHRRPRSSGRLRQSGKGRLLALSVAGVAVAAAAAFTLLPRHTNVPLPDSPAASDKSAAIAQPAPLSEPTLTTGAISPLTEPSPVPSAPTATASTPPEATPSVRAAAPPPPPPIAKRKIAKHSAKAAGEEPKTVYVPPQTTPLATTPEATKPPKLRVPAIAARSGRERRPAAEAAPPAIAPEDTVTIDGLTYIKGREPHMLDAQPLPPDAATDQVSAPGDAATPQPAVAPAAAIPSAEPPATSASPPQNPAPFDQ